MKRFKSLKKAGMSLWGYKAIGSQLYVFADYFGPNQLMALGELAKSEPSIRLFHDENTNNMVISLDA